MSVLGTTNTWEPSPIVAAAVAAAVGAELDRSALDDHVEFHSPTGCAGLCRVDGGELHVLAVFNASGTPGAFRDFIDQAKREFTTIAVWEVWNPWLPAVLERYGFTPAQYTDADGDRVRGYRWRAPVLQESCPVLTESHPCAAYLLGALPKEGGHG